MLLTLTGNRTEIEKIQKFDFFCVAALFYKKIVFHCTIFFNDQILFKQILFDNFDQD